MSKQLTYEQSHQEEDLNQSIIRWGHCVQEETVYYYDGTFSLIPPKKKESDLAVPKFLLFLFVLWLLLFFLSLL